MPRNIRKPRKGEPMPREGEHRWATIYKKRCVVRFAKGTDGELWAWSTDGRWHWLGELSEISEPLVDPKCDAT